MDAPHLKQNICTSFGSPRFIGQRLIYCTRYLLHLLICGTLKDGV
jgi:hypothetical protein